MQICVDLSAKQLVALHAKLEAPENKIGEATSVGDDQHYFVRIASIEGNGEPERPFPQYSVKLIVVTSYSTGVGSHIKTPMDRLQTVLQAIDLFPS